MSGAGARTAVVVGASLAGVSAVRAFRAQGYDGRLVLLGAEDELPYDRPPLSKEFLAGRVGAADIRLVSEAELEELDVEWCPGDPAAALQASDRAVRTAGGRELTADYVVLATGAVARTLPPGAMPASHAHAPAGVHTLRTLADSEALREALTGNTRVVVVGAGFIGSEVAATARGRGCEVDVVEALPAPLAGPLGERMGAAWTSQHSEHGVRLHCGVGVAALHGADRVREVELDDGTRLPADAVVVGVGARPADDWLAGSGLVLDGGVRCDSDGRTALPGVVAVGDLARADSAWTAGPVRVEHWTHAMQQPARAVAALLAGAAEGSSGEGSRGEPAPYFWSEAYGRRLQFAGAIEAGDEVRVLAGEPGDPSWLAVYERGGAASAVLGVDSGREFTRLRRSLRPRYAEPEDEHG